LHKKNLFSIKRKRFFKLINKINYCLEPKLVVVDSLLLISIPPSTLYRIPSFLRVRPYVSVLASETVASILNLSEFSILTGVGRVNNTSVQLNAPATITLPSSSLRVYAVATILPSSVNVKLLIATTGEVLDQAW